jgi:hypothetical protein
MFNNTFLSEFSVSLALFRLVESMSGQEVVAALDGNVTAILLDSHGQARFSLVLRSTHGGLPVRLRFEIEYEVASTRARKRATLDSNPFRVSANNRLSRSLRKSVPFAIQFRDAFEMLHCGRNLPPDVKRNQRRNGAAREVQDFAHLQRVEFERLKANANLKRTITHKVELAPLQCLGARLRLWSGSIVQRRRANSWRAVSPVSSAASRSAPAASNECKAVKLDVRPSNTVQRRPTIVVTCTHVCPSSKQQNSAIAIVHPMQRRCTVVVSDIHVGASVEEPPKRNDIRAQQRETCCTRNDCAPPNQPQTLTSISNTSASRQRHAADVQRRAVIKITNSRTTTPRSISAWMAAVLVAANRHKSDQDRLPLKRRTGLEQHQRTTPTRQHDNSQRTAKSGLPIHINGGKIRLASKEQRKHVVPRLYKAAT